MMAPVRRPSARPPQHLDYYKRHSAVAVASYIAAGEKQGAARAHFPHGQTNISKDVLSLISRAATYIFPPGPSLKLAVDVRVAYRQTPKWNPTNVCSYQLSGRRERRQCKELAFALATSNRARPSRSSCFGQVPDADSRPVVGRIISSSIPASVLVTESARCGPSPFVGQLWPVNRLGHPPTKAARFSLWRVPGQFAGPDGSSRKQRPIAILLEMLAVHTVQKSARPRGASFRRGTRRWACRGLLGPIHWSLAFIISWPRKQKKREEKKKKAKKEKKEK